MPVEVSAGGEALNVDGVANSRTNVPSAFISRTNGLTGTVLSPSLLQKSVPVCLLMRMPSGSTVWVGLTALLGKTVPLGCSIGVVDWNVTLEKLFCVMPSDSV